MFFTAAVFPTSLGERKFVVKMYAVDGNANQTRSLDGTSIENRANNAPNNSEVNMTETSKVEKDNMTIEGTRRQMRGRPFMEGFQLECSRLDDDDPDADLAALSEFDLKCRDKFRGMTLRDFVTAVEKQTFFDSETGDIDEIMYRRHCYEDRKSVV